MKTLTFTFLLFAQFSFFINAQENLTEGLVLYLPFNGNFNDESGNGNNGAATGAVLGTDQRGLENSACHMDGEEDYIVVPGNDWFNGGEKGFSVAFSAFIDTSQNGNARIISWSNGGSSGWEVTLYGNTNNMTSWFYNDTGDYRVYTDIVLGEWNHFALVFEKDSLKAKTYANGKLMVEAYCWFEPAGGFDLNIGKPVDGVYREFTGIIDDIRIYNRPINHYEAALLSGNQNQIDPARKQTSFYANFEEGMQPQQMSVMLNTDGETEGKLAVVPNPAKDEVNNSDSVLLSATFKSSTHTAHSRAEYAVNGFLETVDTKHTYQWMWYFPENHIINIDNIWAQGGWHYLSQYSSGRCEPEGICNAGAGIFNHFSIVPDDHTKYQWEFRAEPDCHEVDWPYTEGRWIKFTFEIYYTREFDGFYNIWINNEFYSGKDSIRTLPYGFRDDCNIYWKIGQYSSWTDEETDSVYYYIDNLEQYIDKKIEDVCPSCVEIVNSTRNIQPGLEVEIFPNPATDEILIRGLETATKVSVYNMQGILEKQVFVNGNLFIGDLKNGVYMLAVSYKGSLIKKTIIIKQARL